MRLIATDGVAWSVGRWVCLSITTVSPAKMAEPIEIGLTQETMYCMGVQIPTCEGANLRAKKGRIMDMPGHVRRSIYSKRLSRGQHRYGADADWRVLDRSALWRHLANTTQPSVCGGDAAL